jgi:hypothetical protein
MVQTQSNTRLHTDVTSDWRCAALRAGYPMPTGRDTGALVRHDNRLYYLGGSDTPATGATVVEAYMIPGWVTVNRMPTCSVQMGQSVGVYNSDSMFVVAGTYLPTDGLQTMKYTASTDTWAYGSFRSLPRESVFCEPSERK